MLPDHINSYIDANAFLPGTFGAVSERFLLSILWVQELQVAFTTLSLLLGKNHCRCKRKAINKSRRQPFVLCKTIFDSHNVNLIAMKGVCDAYLLFLIRFLFKGAFCSHEALCAQLKVSSLRLKHNFTIFVQLHRTSQQKMVQSVIIHLIG